MKTTILSTTIVICSFLSACDVQSDITKKSVEKYNPSPTPTINIPTPEPIDPADVVTVDTAQTGPPISVFKSEPNSTINCDKYNKVTINGNGRNVTAKGGCRQLMINGDKNKVTAEAFSEIVVNGTDNTVHYTGFVNGKRPVIADNAGGNTIEKIARASTGAAPSGVKR